MCMYMHLPSLHDNDHHRGHHRCDYRKVRESKTERMLTTFTTFGLLCLVSFIAFNLLQMHVGAKRRALEHPTTSSPLFSIL
jgi:hypothetical protein